MHSEDDTSLSAYPNPVARQLFVHVRAGNYPEVRLSLMNASGRVVKSQTYLGLQEGANTLTLDVDDLTNGVYWLRVERGSRKQARSIVVLK
ncbi:T9SS type A sorting domain-containing protein [Chryseolinea sp. Jin1]|uniref:T9SS type A sorting domain-containing protein n=2 Tax=Chryseolinea lacunae TaxID=2801331 RepID=A0ABS1KY14_9BACT|nr:T9SS type A sorting domain-containing protein [Chryseolinea lacunae]